MSAPGLTLEGKSIIVTGAAQGIGRAISQYALDLGAKVTAVDLNADALNEFQQSVGADRLAIMVGSVAEPELASATVDLAVRSFGSVTGLVNNAGLSRPAMIEKMSVDAWKLVVDVHLGGSFLFLQAVGRHLLERARAGGGTVSGSIINISSDAGRRGTIGQINYAAAKSGAFGLTMSAAREWGKYGVRVNTVGFGVVETPMTETIRGDKFKDTYLSQIVLNRFGTPSEVAGPVCFLLSDMASYITGQHISVNGGYTIGM